MSGVITEAEPTDRIAGPAVFNPLFEVDWRFARVLEMVSHEPRALRCKRRDDVYVQTMRKFLLLYAARDEEGRQELLPEFPGPYMALGIHESNDPEIRLTIECRILSGQSDEEIAQPWGFHSVAIHWFEKMFFNVRERLNHRDWIVRHVLGPARLRKLSNFEFPLKLAAYFHGPATLEFLLSGYCDVERPETREDVERCLSAYTKSGICRTAAMAVHALPVDSQNVLQLFELFRRIQFDQQNMQDPQAGNNVLVECVRETIAGIEFIKGDRAEEKLNQTCPELLKYDSYAAELRDHELYAVIDGKTEGLEHLKDIKFPAPRAHNDPVPPV